MDKFEYVITDPNGLHARPTGLLVKEAQKYSSHITITRKGNTADLKRLFSVMGLNVKCGDSVEIVIEGQDEAAAAVSLATFLKENL